MPRKASGEPKTKRVERRQANGDIYVYEVTTLYNPEKSITSMYPVSCSERNLQ